MNEPKIKIGILSAKKIHFDLSGGYLIGGEGKPLKGDFTVELEDNNMILTRDNERRLFKDNLVFQPLAYEKSVFQLIDVVIGKGFHWERKENQRFSGTLKFIIENDEITAINILPLGDYLISVISSEMSPNSSLEFLKTHAIVSRSWLVSQINNRSSKKTTAKLKESPEGERIKWYDREDHDNYDVCADDHCQRYQGITKVISKTAQRAIEATRGLVLKSEGEICDTRYSKCCGGLTENFENVWEEKKHKYLTAISDYKFEDDDYDYDFSIELNARNWIMSNPNSFCNTTDEKILAQVLVDFDQETKDFYRWKVEFTQTELSELINRKTGVDFGEIKDLIPVERGASARIIKLKIVGTKNTLTVGKELEIRKSISESHLYSSAFIVDKYNIENDVPQKFVLHGCGWGHGVGLCQIGAAVMSEKGYSFDEILFHYFKNSKIEKIY